MVGRERPRRADLLGFLVEGMGEVLPFVDEGGIGGADNLAEPRNDVTQFVGALGLGHCLAQRPVGVGEIAQHEPLTALHLVVGTELAKGHGAFVHVAYHRLGLQGVGGDPRVARGENIEQGVQSVFKGAGPLDLLDGGHPVLVVVAVLFHVRDGLTAGGVLLGDEDGHRIIEGGLDNTDDVKGVAGGIRVEGRNGLAGEGRKWLVESKVVLQRLVHGKSAAPRCGYLEAMDNLGAQQRQPNLDCSAVETTSFSDGRGGGLDKVLDGPGGVLVTLQQVEQHRLGDSHASMEGLRGGFDELSEGFLGVVDESFRWLVTLHFATFLGVVTGLGKGFVVGDDVLGCLRDDVADGVESGTSSSPGDLVKLAGLEDAGASAVKFRQGCEHDGSNWHVDPDAEGVGAADDLEFALLGESFDEAAVFRQHSGMVDADPGGDELAHRRSEPLREAETGDLSGDGVSLFGAHQLH